MSAYQVFLALLFAYVTILIATGWYYSKKKRSLTEFWLAGKTSGTLAIGFSAAASWLTAGALLAVIGFFMLLGMGSVWGFVAPNIIALMVIALFVKKIKRLPSITQPELLELRYGTGLRAPVAIIIMVVMVLFAVADIKGLAMVLQVFYDLPAIYAALIVGIAVAIYVTLGGLSAVIATDMIQFLILGIFVIVMACVVLTGASAASTLTIPELFTRVPDTWFNPFSIGIPMAFIFILAIIPGWITEQDPWQRVWAAKNERAARNGMLLGSLLVALVFGACAVIAVGLNAIYPEIAKAGFPMGMAKAEPALLAFIMESNFSAFALGLCALGLATAAMSCTDTFAASGASCLSRDIFQRYLRPDATMQQMRVVNRVSVLFMVLCATVGAFFIDSIIDAIHIATFIASASYFFVLMGGIYWKRGTAAGAVASLSTGFVIQVGLVVIDLIKTPPMAPPYLESLHPALMGHGVIAAMALSGVAYVGVSLATKPSPAVRLAPFFTGEAKRLAFQLKRENPAARNERDAVALKFREERFDDRVRLRLTVDMLDEIPWKACIRRLDASNDAWVSLAGSESIFRICGADVRSWISVTRGNRESTLCVEAETSHLTLEKTKQDMCVAHEEIEAVLQALAKSHFVTTRGELQTADAMQNG